MTMDVEGLFNVVADSATSDINHPERHIHLERYTYSGRGLENLGFDEGETVWEATFKPYGSYDPLHGYGKTVVEAVLAAAKLGIETQKARAEKELEQASKRASECEAWLVRASAQAAELAAVVQDRRQEP
jgi:hypothetical protein